MAVVGSNGLLLGCVDGSNVGSAEGETVGKAVGMLDIGDEVGKPVRIREGDLEGERVGFGDGKGVGAVDVGLLEGSAGSTDTVGAAVSIWNKAGNSHDNVEYWFHKDDVFFS